MNSQDKQPELLPGTMIGRYQILYTLGRGGMSEVYLALDTELRREVALKLINDTLASDRLSRYLFGAEARAAAGFDHPNSVVIYDIGRHEERPYIAMEYAPGKSLARLCQEKKFSVRESLAIVTQLVECLKTAHEQGIVHGDISATNVMLDEADQVKLLDFGMAGMASQNELTEGVYSGNPSYNAPERIHGGPITPVTDLFSLGVLFYYMLTGKLPFKGDYEAALTYAIVNEDPPAPHTLKKEIPQALSEKVMRLLNKDPERRYQSAGKLLSDLHSIPGYGKRRSGILTLRTTLRWVSGILAVTLVLTLALTSWWSSDENSRRTQPEIPVIAVLPFEHHGPLDVEYLTAGTTNGVTTHLAGIKSLRVISHMSSRKYRNTDKNVTEIGSELDCDYLVTGAVHWGLPRDAKEVTISATLISVSEDKYLWTNTFTLDLKNIHETQVLIVGEVIQALNLQTDGEWIKDVAERLSTDSAAYDLYLRGNDYFYRSWNKTDQRIANDMYTKAVARDSMFAAAYAMLARSHETMFWEYFDRSEERIQQAYQAVTRALELDPDLPEAQLALGYYYYHCEQNYGKALEQFIRVSDDSPENDKLYNAIAAVQRRINEFESAALNFKKSFRLNPRSHQTAFDVGLTYGLLRRYETAEEYIDKSILLAPDWDLPHIYKAWMSIFYTGDLERAREIIRNAKEVADLSTSRYYWWLSRMVAPSYQQARAEMRISSDSAAYYLQKAQLSRLLSDDKTVELYADSAFEVAMRQRENRPDDPRYLSELGLAYAALGEREMALENTRLAVERLPTSRDTFDALFLILNYAEVLLLFGEYDQAIDQLESLLLIPGFISEPYLRIDPLWKPLWGRKNFEALLQKVSAE